MTQRIDNTQAPGSLSDDVNKNYTEGSENENVEGVVTAMPELSIETSNEDLLKTFNQWKSAWEESDVKSEWEDSYKKNRDFWLGAQKDKIKASKKSPDVDNVIFESYETLLPLITRRNPEPLIKQRPGSGSDELDETAKNQILKEIKENLAYIADEKVLRLKLKKSARHWGIFLIGALKFGWDLESGIPDVKNVMPYDLIFDKDAINDEDGYTGYYVGHRRKLEYSALKTILESSDGEKDGIAALNEIEKDKRGSKIAFIEWWTKEYVCWQMGDKILLKKKNPHWNYDEEEENTTTNDYGEQNAEKVLVPGVNHLSAPGIPFSFLVVFSLGDKPVDNTSLISQNIENQKRINRRNEQIDKNVRSMNGGLVVSLQNSGLTPSQAKRVARALRDGGLVAIPSGDPQSAVWKPPISGLPADVFNDKVDMRVRMRDIFGIRGSSAAGLASEDTVRGKFINRGLDTDRIGGGISEYLEQQADDVYNWFIQLLYVYDPVFKNLIVDSGIGKLDVSVKEGSLLPKDSASLAAQAIELAKNGKMSNVDLYKALEYPNAEDMAANVWLENNAPQVLYKDNPLVMEALGQIAEQAQGAEAAEMQKAQSMAELEVKKEAAKQEVQTIANTTETALNSLAGGVGT